MRISAHHAFAAEYDENKRVTVSGTVTRFEWINPHVWLYVAGKDENDRVTGWRQMELKRCDQVTVEGYRAKDRARPESLLRRAYPMNTPCTACWQHNDSFFERVVRHA